MKQHTLIRWAASWAMIAAMLMPLAVRAGDMEAPSALPDPQVTAAASVVVEIATGAILWGHDIHAIRPPASVTKMMTALVAMDLGTLETKVTVQQSDLVGESNMGLENGETVTIEALIFGMLLPSGNDAATALARSLGKQPGDANADQSVQRFVEKMNAKAKALGTKETHFANPHGLDEPNHVTSAADLALIGMAFAANPTLMRIAGTVTYDGFGHTVHNLNKLLYDGRFPSVIGGKTGQTDDAGYTLIEIATKNGRRLLSVELGTDADSFWTDAMHLLIYGYATPPPVKGQPTETHHIVPRARTTVFPTTTPPAQRASEPMAALIRTAPGSDQQIITSAEVTQPATLTLPATYRSDRSLILRMTVLGLMAAVVCGYVFARRSAVRETFAQMRREWNQALADPPHLVATTQMPIIPRQSGAGHGGSSRWEHLSAATPKGGQEVARAYAMQAVRQATSGSRLAAQQAFRRAVGIAPRMEWGAIPGFWELPPVSYADLATALIDAGYPAIARSMLTVAALAHPRHPDLRAVEARLNPRAPQPPIRILRDGG